MKNHKLKKVLLFVLGFVIVFAGCQKRTKKELAFKSSLILDSVEYFWAHCPADITGDKIADVVFIHNNARGGYLAYYEGTKDSSLWKKHMIAERSPDGALFASGDLECADIDSDGDIDVMAPVHPGEWVKADTASMLYWYENPGWEAHPIGTVPGAVKDMSIVDFDKDGKMDLAILTYDENTLSIFQQKGADDWEKVQYYHNYKNMHEGMDVGDLNGDGWPDILANGQILYSPGQDLKADWTEDSVGEKWNKQTGDWSKNATKAFLQDMDGDGKDEIFISHSERSGYPLACYKQDDNGAWQENIISDSIPACHTLQVFDFDLDGDYDVMAGVNKGRAVNLNKESFELTLFLNEDSKWIPMILETEGIYNGQAIDYDNDGDIDIFRYPHHEATELFLLENQLK